MLASYLVCLSLVLPLIQQRDYGQPSAALWGDQLFVATSGNIGFGILAGSIYRGTLRLNNHVVLAPTEYWDHSTVAPIVSCSQTKLEVRDNRVLWYTAGGQLLIVPFTELPCLEASSFGEELCRLRHGYPHPSRLT